MHLKDDVHTFVCLQRNAETSVWFQDDIPGPEHMFEFDLVTQQAELASHTIVLWPEFAGLMDQTRRSVLHRDQDTDA